MTRTDLVLDAIRRELEHRRLTLDTFEGSASVQLTVKLRDNDRPWVRAVIFSLLAEAEERDLTTPRAVG